MTDKFFLKIQNDIKKSNPKIINNDDNVSKIKKNYDHNYNDDLTNSDDESSYRKRNKNIIDKVENKINNNKNKINNNKNKIKIIENDEINTNNSINNNSINNDIKSEKNDDENSTNDINNYEFLEDFHDKVKQYVKADDKIRELQILTKEQNLIKKKSEQEILKHLERLGDNKINISGGKLKINQYESKDGFKETIVKDVLTEKIKDPKIIENIFEIINEKRKNNTTTQLSLKRTFESKKN